MKTRNYLLIIILFAISSVNVFAQAENWQELNPLESTREDVEAILGKPSTFFESYGLYKTDFGKFSVWFSSGGCKKNVAGRQYDVAANKMTGLSVTLYKPVQIEKYICRKEDFKKEKGSFGRYLYKSADESKIYKVLPLQNGIEMVLSIRLEPSKDEQSLLCKENLKTTDVKESKLLSTKISKR